MPEIDREFAQDIVFNEYQVEKAIQNQFLCPLLFSFPSHCENAVFATGPISGAKIYFSVQPDGVYRTALSWFTWKSTKKLFSWGITVPPWWGKISVTRKCTRGYP